MKQDIYLIGLNHRTAGVEVREAFALAEAGLLENGLLPISGPMQPGAPVQEAMVLSTCNRVEILAVGTTDLSMPVMNAWASACGKKTADLQPYVYRYTNREAVNHLFTVASSLDSMVLGEPQILGQLKDAYKTASGIGCTKVILNKLLHKAFSVAKRVRSETGVASSAVSVSYAAVELAKRIFGSVDAHKAMLIGAGEMAELAATHLMNAGVKSVWVANRTYQKAIELAEHYNGLAVPFEQLFEQLPEVDIVISSTGAPTAFIRAKDMHEVMKRRKNKPMFFIDIAVPRNIAPDVNSLDNIYLYDIDDLKEVVETNLAQRRNEAVKAMGIVDSETDEFLAWMASLDLQPAIVELVRRTEGILHQELNKTLRRLNPDEATRSALEAMVAAMAKKLDHEPITFIKQAFHEGDGAHSVGVVRRVFDLCGEKKSGGLRCPFRQTGKK